MSQESKNNRCHDCKHWSSYEDIYEDPLEPNDLGVCHNKASPAFDQGRSMDDSCSKFEPIVLT